MKGNPPSAGLGRSLRNRNFRMYLVGQGVSHAGMWIQMVAELWLIVELTDSGLALAIHSLLRLGPVLLFGILGGLLGDRTDRRRLLIGTQFVHTIAASILATVVFVTAPTLGLVYSIVLVQGIVNAVDNPIRRTFIRDLVNDSELSNAVGLHNVVSTVSRALGPAIAGMLISSIGLAWCFAINAASYLVVLIYLLVIDQSKLRARVPVPRERGQLREGMRYAWSHRQIKVTLLLSCVAAMFAWQWNVVLPIYARSEFNGDARTYGFLLFALSAGSVVGALYSAGLQRLGGRHLRWAGGAVSIALISCSLALSLPIAYVSLAAWGAATSAFNIGAQSRLQLAAQEQMTARVMSFYSVVFAGSKPLGALLIGVIVDAANARAGLAVGALALGVATITYALSNRRRRSTPPKGDSTA